MFSTSTVRYRTGLKKIVNDLLEEDFGSAVFYAVSFMPMSFFHLDRAPKPMIIMVKCEICV